MFVTHKHTEKQQRFTTHAVPSSENQPLPFCQSEPNVTPFPRADVAAEPQRTVSAESMLSASRSLRRVSSSLPRWLSLAPAAGFAKPAGPVALIILDGVGLNADARPDDAWQGARTPFLDSLLLPGAPTKLKGQLKAHGTAVGMPDDSDMSNSEVGHNALGSGRVFDQGAKLVGNAMADGSYKSEVGRPPPPPLLRVLRIRLRCLVRLPLLLLLLLTAFRPGGT